MSDDKTPRALGRRDLMKVGVGVVATALAAQRTSAQRGAELPPSQVPPPGSPPPDTWRPYTGAGYKNEANRLDGNGPMDETTRKIVKYVHDFKEADMTPSVVKAVNRTMVDSMASAVAGVTCCTPLTFRTYCNAAAWISSAVAAGSNPRRRHRQCRGTDRQREGPEGRDATRAAWRRRCRS